MAMAPSTSYNFGIGAGTVDHIDPTNDTAFAGDLPPEERSPYILAKEKKVKPQSSTVCRYYAAGNCRRGSACRFMHPQHQGNVQQGVTAPFFSPRLPQTYAYLAIRVSLRSRNMSRREHHMRGGIKTSAYSHGYITYPMYTIAPYAAPQGFDASRDILDNFSDFSSSNDSAPSDQSLNTAFEAMAIKESVSSEPYPSAFSQSLPSLQYPNNTGTRYDDVASPGYYRGYIPTSSNTRASTGRQAEAMKRLTLHKTKPCNFFSARKTCSQGDKCRFIHDVEKCKRAKKADNQHRGTAPSHLPPKPRSLLEAFKARDYYPVTWRVIGGGVMMGGYRLPCKAFAAGHCPDGADCKLAHETELETSTNGVVHLKTQSSAVSQAGPPPANPSVDSSAESNRRNVSTDCSPSAPNPSIAVSSEHRRTRSMSMPSSPSVFRAPHIFAEL
ncbi:hypothetical protein DFH29DRAFT_416817 [Suillus ampliporus]|nr:hypothetical protein DFH29DRAFT_416817 [Suillus ampliporus]